MFLAMKSRRRTFTPPCNFTICSCYCHNSETPAYKEREKINDRQDRNLLLKVGLFFLIFIVIVSISLGKCTPVKRTIKVNGKECDIVYIQDGSNSHGGSYGHEEVICK